jgi:hypothetical protein
MRSLSWSKPCHRHRSVRWSQRHTKSDWGTCSSSSRLNRLPQLSKDGRSTSHPPHSSTPRRRLRSGNLVQKMDSHLDNIYIVLCQLWVMCGGDLEFNVNYYCKMIRNYASTLTWQLGDFVKKMSLLLLEPAEVSSILNPKYWHLSSGTIYAIKIDNKYYWERIRITVTIIFVLFLLRKHKRQNVVFHNII